MKDNECRCGAYTFTSSENIRTCSSSGMPPTECNDTNEEKCRNALELVLMFYSSEPWTKTRRKEWMERTRGQEATTRVMCDEVREALGLLPSCFGDWKGETPDSFPEGVPLSREQKEALDRLGCPREG